MSTGMPEPRHTQPLSSADIAHVSPHDLNDSNDFVAGDERQLGIGKIAVDDVQISAAHGAGFHPQANLSWSRDGIGPFL